MLDLNWHLFRERYKFLKFLNFPKSCKQRNCTSFTRDGAEWSVAEGDGWRRSLAILRGKSYGMKWWPMTCLHTVNLAQNEKWWQAKVTTYWREIVPEININVRNLKRRATKAGHLVAIRSWIMISRMLCDQRGVMDICGTKNQLKLNMQWF